MLGFTGVVSVQLLSTPVSSHYDHHPPLPALEAGTQKEILRKGPEMATGKRLCFLKDIFYLLFNFASSWP